MNEEGVMFMLIVLSFVAGYCFRMIVSDSIETRSILSLKKSKRGSR